jgi:hypothetical protein
VACYGQLGWHNKAFAQDAEFRAKHLGHSLLQYAAIEPYENAVDLDHVLDGLRKAGVSA